MPSMIDTDTSQRPAAKQIVPQVGGLSSFRVVADPRSIIRDHSLKLWRNVRKENGGRQLAGCCIEDHYQLGPVFELHFNIPSEQRHKGFAEARKHTQQSL